MGYALGRYHMHKLPFGFSQPETKGISIMNEDIGAWLPNKLLNHVELINLHQSGRCFGCSLFHAQGHFVINSKHRDLHSFDANNKVLAETRCSAQAPVAAAGQ